MESFSNRIYHFFHVVSNVRPIVWIGLYVAVTPVFALIYWLLPEGQFRIPDDNPMDYGACLYYSIVTITTLGFGDYTPTHAWSQGVTACEVMCGLIVLGLFLNAVGSMKSEIDVTSALERQRLLHFNEERDKLVKNTPVIIHHINNFLSNCYLATTPASKRSSGEPMYNPDFTIEDMVDIGKADRSGVDIAGRTVVEDLLASATRTSLFIDSVQNRVDISLWGDLLEDFFAFVATEQMFTSSEGRKVIEAVRENATCIVDASAPGHDVVVGLYHFIKKNAATAMKIESALSEICMTQSTTLKEN